MKQSVYRQVRDAKIVDVLMCVRKRQTGNSQCSMSGRHSLRTVRDYGMNGVIVDGPSLSVEKPLIESSR